MGTLAESSQTVNETKDEFQGMGSIIGNHKLSRISRSEYAKKYSSPDSNCI